MLSMKDGSSERYDLNGHLLSDTDRFNKTTSYSYDTNGRLSTVTEPYGHTLTLGYNTTGHIVSVTMPSGIYTYNYTPVSTSSGDKYNLTTVTYPDGSAKLYHYENTIFIHHLTGISYVDSVGVTTRYSTYAYDPTGKAILTQHATTTNGLPQEKFTLTYNSDTQTTVTDPVNMNEIMTFNTNLGLKNLTLKVNQSDSKTMAQVFDTNNNLTCRKDEENRVTLYSYSATNQRTSMTEGMTGECTSPVSVASVTRITTYQYLSPTLDLPTVVESPSVAGETYKKRITLAYGDSRFPALPTGITQSGYTPSGTSVFRTVTLGYNTHGQMSLINGPRTDVNDVTALEYYECTIGGACGQLKKVTNALGHITTYDLYDANGRVTQVTDANGLRTNYSYDARGRVRFITQTPPAGSPRTTEYRYTAAGNVQTAIMPDGVALTYGYDAAQYLRSITDNLGNRIAYHYDLKGNRDGEDTTDSSGTLVRSVGYAYDLRNRLSTINAAGSVTQQVHDAVGNLLQEIDPNNNPATQHTPDVLNRLVQTVDRLNGVTAYAYDRNDRLTQLQAPNGATTGLVYDDLGNLLQETSPDRGTTIYAHDAAGNVSGTTDARGIAMVYTYDALNRLMLIDYPGAEEDVGFTYDSGVGCSFGIGRLCQGVDESGTTQYGYDAFGNTTETRKTELGVTYVTRYTYDAADRIATITYPDNRLVSYTRDALGRLQGASATVNGATQTLLAGRTYRADGLFVSQTYGNGLNEARQYNLKGELTYQSLGSANTRVYIYDPNGNLTQRQSLPAVATYAYDALDRLTGETQGPITGSLTYDANGNRVSASVNTLNATLTYTPDSNRLTGVTLGPLSDTLTLDAAGNHTSFLQGKITLHYNNAGRLTTLKAASLPLGRYLYNAQGLRTRKTVGLQTTVYHYDVAGNLILETTPTGVVRVAYVYADAVPIAHLQRVSSTDRLTYLHTDHLGTPRVGTNANQTAVWRWEADAFGALPPNTDPDGDGRNTVVNLRFPGQYYDQETGLHYNWNRYYDPKTGRYVSSDPIGLKGGLNTYTYVGNNPVNWIDPLGLQTSCCNQDFLTCLAKCIEQNDPLNLLGKGALTASGGTFPKSWIGQPRAFGSGPVTTVPSASVLGSGAAGTAVRTIGRIYSPIWISYGLYLAGMETWCTGACLGDKCAF